MNSDSIYPPMESLTTEGSSHHETVDALLKACSRGDVKHLGEFIINGGELKEAVDRNGRNALHYCVRCSSSELPPENIAIFEQRDRIKCARIIVKTNAEFLTMLDSDGLSALHLAVVQNDLDFIEAIVELKPSLNIKTGVSKRTNSADSEPQATFVGGRTAIHLAVINEHLDALKLLFHTDVASAINTLDSQGATALHYAVQLTTPQEEQALRLLVSEGEADVNAVDSHGRTALSWAATIGATQAVELLLKLGAKLNIRDECGLTPLHCAASRGNHAVVQCILNWIRVANMDDLSKMAAFRDVTDNDGCTPLFYSVTIGHDQVTHSLLEAGANINTVDSKGRTLAHCLARIESPQTEQGRASIVVQMTELVNSGLDMWKVNNAGATALHEGCLLRNVAFVIELAKHKAFEQTVNFCDRQGHTPLHLVVAASWSTDLAGVQICECLLKHGAEVNATTVLPHGGNVTALDLAIMNEKEEKVKSGLIRNLLVSYGAKTFQELKQIEREQKKKDLENLTKQQPEIHKEILVDGNNDTVTDEPLSVRAITPTTKIKLDKETLTQVVVSDKATSTYVTVPKEDRVTTISCTTSRQQSFATQTTQTSRGSQTEFEFDKLCLADLRRQSVADEKSRIVVAMPNADTTEVDNTYSEHSKPVFSDNQSEAKRKRSSVIRPCSRPSTNNTSSTSIRVNTPMSTKSEQQVSIHPAPRRFRSQDLKPKASVSKKKDKLPIHPEPFSQIYLERTLPALLDRYMHTDDHQVSTLTGRYRMPKPTLSPYLLPLVPTLSTNTKYTSNKLTASCKKQTKTVEPRKNPIRRSNDDSSQNYPPIHGSPQKSTSKHQLHSEPERRVQQSVADFEYYRLLNELFKMENHHKAHGYMQPGRSVTSQPNHSRSRAPVKTDHKKKRTKSSHTRHVSAMGGELSPIGRKEHSASPHSERPSLKDNEIENASVTEDVHRGRKRLVKKNITSD
ncbi:hypothetical protein PHET_01609 [Paragonimus heterotremus]|uniref:Inversin n=1 Tax=Paragonimus heterotremus TaxID=100268 RepID=A0A8J4STK4_9TREM|nr:hypothetical protein PHET_01609 [Paragonimus heterotremus]